MRDTHTRQLVLMCMRLLTMWLYEADRKEEGNVYYHQLICVAFPFLRHVSKTHSLYVVFPNILVVKMFVLYSYR